MVLHAAGLDIARAAVAPPSLRGARTLCGAPCGAGEGGAGPAAAACPPCRAAVGRAGDRLVLDFGWGPGEPHW